MTLSTNSRQLIEAARPAGAPTAEQMAQLEGLLMASVATSLTASTATAVTAKFGATKLLFVGVLSAAVGAGITAVSVKALRPQASALKPPSPVTEKNHAERNRPKETAPPPGVPVVAELSAPVQTPATAPAPAPAIDPRHRSPAQPSSTPPAAREVAVVNPAVATSTPHPVTERAPAVGDVELLSVAVGALDEGRMDDALAALARHELAFPHSRLRVEAVALRIEALCKLGRTNEAQSLAQQLDVADRANPAVQRLRQLCVEFR